MLQSENHSGRFINLHLEFVEECKQINNDMKVLYAMPHQFMKENASAIDQFMADAKIPGTPDSFNRSLHGVKDFVYQLEDFKIQTMQLFFEHRMHTDKCTEYLQKSQELRAQNRDGSSTCPEPSDDLIKELKALRFGLNCIREKADIMTNQLGAIKSKWEVISNKD